MKRAMVLVVACAGLLPTLPVVARMLPTEGRPKPNHDPDAAEFVVSDIDLFWKAYDSAKPENRAEVLRKEYLEKGSQGLRGFTRVRIGSAESLAKAIETHPKYYASLRAVPQGGRLPGRRSRGLPQAEGALRAGGLPRRLLRHRPDEFRRYPDRQRAPDRGGHVWHEQGHGCRGTRRLAQGRTQADRGHPLHRGPRVDPLPAPAECAAPRRQTGQPAAGPGARQGLGLWAGADAGTVQHGDSQQRADEATRRAEHEQQAREALEREMAQLRVRLGKARTPNGS